MEEPTDTQVLDAICVLYNSDPNLGRAKALATLKTQNNWDLGNKRFKQLFAASAIARNTADQRPKQAKEEGKTYTNDMDLRVGHVLNGDTTNGANGRTIPSKEILPQIKLPNNAHEALVHYRETSRRCFRIYGRGEYDYGVSPNMDQQVLIGICHNRLLKLGAPGPWNPKMKLQIGRSSEMNTIWNYWWAAGRKVGLKEEDIGRQLEAEYGVDPRPWLPVLTQAQIKRRKAVFKAESLELKRAMLKADPEARKVIAVNEDGEPLWDDKIHGEYTVLVVKISKEDGVTEYGPAE